MLNISVPQLGFPEEIFGPKETAWDFRCLLYRGGAQAPIRQVSSMINAGAFGGPLVERIHLVRMMHESLLNFLASGGQRSTVESCILVTRNFFQWADQLQDLEVSLTTIEQTYRQWCDILIHRVRVKREVKEVTVYGYASRLGWLFDRVLERDKSLIKSTRLYSPKRGPRVLVSAVEKQELNKTFDFGHLLLDISDGLRVDAIWGELPVRISLRNGVILEEWSRLRSPESLASPNSKWPVQAKQSQKRSAQKRADWEAEKSYRTRYPLINLRIIVEMLMLMGQPAVNLAEVHQLRMDQWRFKTSDKGYEIRTYKHRRWGPVVFEIYSEYRVVFARYLEWRKVIFPNDDDGLLFPLLGLRGGVIERRANQSPDFNRLRSICKRAGVDFIGPRALRNANVNWMLRRTGDPDLTASEKQHAKRTLLGVYEKPSLQRSMLQMQVFWTEYDPALAAPGPVSCSGKAPKPSSDAPPTATQPDCMTPSGCLFCEYQRDIDSFDHVWSLTSFRTLKSFELRAQLRLDNGKSTVHPADLAIERITAKLNFIESSNPQRAQWVKEAMLRMEEERFHPAWSQLVESL